jgi:ATP adenylyltransferase
MESGVLVVLPTSTAIIERNGVRFQVRILDTEQQNEALEAINPSARKCLPPTNPFLPYEQSLFVADLSESHIVILNKYCVFDHHLLIITRKFRDQREILTCDDFFALNLCMREYEGLGFFNGGQQAGASQPHKHLQFVPLPLCHSETGVPIEALFGTAIFSQSWAMSNKLPFLHAVSSLTIDWSGDSEEIAEILLSKYKSLIQALELIPADNSHHTPHPNPYNLLCTREWMMVIPRSCEFYADVSLNALGFAGCFFVRNDREFSALQHIDPLDILLHTGYARP